MALAALTALYGVPTKDVTERTAGPWRLCVMGHNIVVAPEVQKGPLSREASAPMQWIASDEIRH